MAKSRRAHEGKRMQIEKNSVLLAIAAAEWATGGRLGKDCQAAVFNEMLAAGLPLPAEMLNLSAFNQALEKLSEEQGNAWFGKFPKEARGSAYRLSPAAMAIIAKAKAAAEKAAASSK